MAGAPVSQRAHSGEPALEDLVAMFRAQHAKLERAQRKDFEDLLGQYEYIGGLLMKEYQVSAARKERAKELEQETQALRAQGFVAVLIDGDGICLGPEHRFFQTELLRKGTFGGETAAALLKTGFLNKVRVNYPEIDDEAKIRISIYGNIRDLADVCWREGIVPDPSIVKDFARGFSSTRIHCDFIDVGPGCASTKSIELFSALRGDGFCRQIYYGTSSDRGWEKFIKNITVYDDLDLINLIEGPDIGKDVLPLKTVTWEDVLRAAKTDSPAASKRNSLDPVAAPFRPQTAGNKTQATDTTAPPMRKSTSDFFASTKGNNAAKPPPIGAERGTNGTKSRGATPTQPNFPSLTQASYGKFFNARKTIGFAESEKEKKKLVLTMRRPVYTEQIASSAAEGASSSRVPSWASAAKRGLEAPSIEPFPKASTPPLPAATRTTGLIPRNRQGQRIDPALPNFNKEEIDRVKKIKMCNVHFLRGPCAYGPACKRNHDYKPLKSELESLRHVSRMACCVHGTGCDDPSCIFGHRCPFPVLAGSAKKGKNCMFGETCKFPVEMHNMDLNQVYTTVVR